MPHTYVALSVQFHQCSILMLPCQYNSTNAPYLRCPVSTIPPMLHTYLYLNATVVRKSNKQHQGNFQPGTVLYVYRNTEACSCYHCCSGKAISTTYSECVFIALVLQHAMRMRHTVIRGLSGSTIFFHIISSTARFSKKKKKLLNVKHVLRFSLQLLSATFLIPREFSEILSQICVCLHVKNTLLLSDFNETLIISTDFRKNVKIQNFVKVPSVVAESFHADGQRDTTKLIVAFRNFANAPKKRNAISETGSTG
jgi:hypothetical protein